MWEEEPTGSTGRNVQGLTAELRGSGRQAPEGFHFVASWNKHMCLKPFSTNKTLNIKEGLWEGMFQGRDGTSRASGSKFAI